MGYVLLFIVVFVTVVLIKGGIEKKKRGQQEFKMNEFPAPECMEEDPLEHFPKMAEFNRKMEEKTAWMEADTKRMQEERERRKAAKQAEKQAKIDFKNRNKR